MLKEAKHKYEPDREQIYDFDIRMKLWEMHFFAGDPKMKRHSDIILAHIFLLLLILLIHFFMSFLPFILQKHSQ